MAQRGRAFSLRHQDYAAWTGELGAGARLRNVHAGYASRCGEAHVIGLNLALLDLPPAHCASRSAFEVRAAWGKGVRTDLQDHGAVRSRRQSGDLRFAAESQGIR
jgi:hypothetical protein